MLTLLRQEYTDVVIRSRRKRPQKEDFVTPTSSAIRDGRQQLGSASGLIEDRA